MVQDPNFWRRFSVAVHNDEAAMLAADLESGQKGKRETKHAYVVSLTSPIDSPSSISTPTSQCHLSPAFPPSAFTRPLSAPASALSPPLAAGKKTRKEVRKSHATSGTQSIYFDADEERQPEMIALHKLTSCPQPILPFPSNTLDSSLPSTPKSTHFALPPPPPLTTPPSHRASKRASRFRFALTSHPPSQPSTPKSLSFPSPHPSSSKRTSRFFTQRPNGSRLSLGVSLSGRPKSAFRFWTTIEADAPNRDSWLEGERRKARQRAYMCWAFWGGFLVVVVGAIVAVLVLKGKEII